MGSVLGSWIGTVLATVSATALVAIAAGLIKVMVDVGRMGGILEGIQHDIEDMRKDPDVMRWSQGDAREYVHGWRPRNERHTR